MRSASAGALMATIALLALAPAGTAWADSNRNVHSPSILCGPGPLTVSRTHEPCVARQTGTQRIVKEGTTDFDGINYIAAAVPGTVG
ncbi:hypothetical protein [Streptomyces sp. URMC 123]|uniref:hypothetical protein n=1 Tax=Streptomyces sp. URMC 123 TaxID=3423403 RepID=UPI003F1BFCD0